MAQDTGGSRRVSATVPRDMYDSMCYIAKKRECTIPELIRDSIQLMIRYENEDYYPLATLTSARINQLTDHIIQLSSNVRNVEQVMLEGFSSLIELTRGDNYLFEEDENV